MSHLDGEPTEYRLMIHVDDKQAMLDALQSSLDEAMAYVKLCRAILINRYGACPDSIDMESLRDGAMGQMIQCAIHGASPLLPEEWVADRLSSYSDHGLKKCGLTRGQYEVAKRGWEFVIPLMRSGYHRQIAHKVDELRETAEIYPPAQQVFAAMDLVPFDQVRVVILGQDPYHGPGQANGLAFSVPVEINTPPSLRNIFKEIAADIDGGQYTLPRDSDLSDWCRQGVLLLNTTLTVERGKPGSHRNIGWQPLTDQIISTLSEKRTGLVFMLWGNHAREKRSLIDATRHLVLEAPHPSPLSARRGFFGCRHFSQCNEYLIQPIWW